MQTLKLVRASAVSPASNGGCGLKLAAQVQALANKSGKTRNATIATLLEVGLEEVRGRLSPETIEELEAIEQEVLQDEFGHLFAKEA